MNLEQTLSYLLQQQEISRNICHHLTLPKAEAQWGEFPPFLQEGLVTYLRSQGIRQPYTHQSKAWQSVAEGEDVVVVTPTASGKTLCYNVPVLNAIMQDNSARALYLFPTKALAQDQLKELEQAATEMGVDIKSFTYDGDTRPSARQMVRTAGHIVISNPDMLHTGILPHHTKWVKLFQNLRFIVVDELHTYRGVFGSHVANVLRRLLRLCHFYGSNPQFICSSATIANPGELAEQLIGRQVRLVDENGAPRGERHILFYNPPVVNQQLGIRQGSLLAATRLAELSLANRLKTIVFSRSRQSVELILSYLERNKQLKGKVAAYRGGYLPNERRTIERSLREGNLLGVVSTNALELGVDIGQLEVCIMAGYPGGIANAWQQMGRVGRRMEPSLSILVASSLPLDQHLMNHPEYFFNQAPENGFVNPENLLIQVSHLKCAAFELPFRQEELSDDESRQEIVDFLAEAGVLRSFEKRYFWMADSFPAEEIGLRSASIDNFVIIDTSKGARVIGEIDRLGAMTMVHDEAIYLHQGQQYHVDKLDFAEKKAYVHPVSVDYYTDANLAVNLQVLSLLAEDKGLAASFAQGEVSVTAFATIFKKVRLYTHENVGWGKIRLPEEQLHTTSFWVSWEPPAELTPDQVEGGLLGLAQVIKAIAPIFLLVDSKDLGVACQVRSPFTGKPTIYLYDLYPGGTGLAEKLFIMRRQILETAIQAIAGCACQSGCPSCVGPLAEVGERGKEVALLLARKAQAAQQQEASQPADS